MDNNKDKSICRSCLEGSENLSSIFKFYKFNDKENFKLSTVLNYCTNLEINEEDDFPSMICNKCVDKVLIAFKFKQQFIRSNKILKRNFELAIANNKQIATNLYFEHIVIKPEPADEGNFEINFDVENSDTLTHKIQTIVCEQTNNSSSESLETTPFDKSIKKSRKRRKPIDKQTTCKICSKIMKNSSLKNHMTLHSDLKPFQCKECGESFKTRYSRDGHLTNHFPNLNKCKFCGKIFKQARVLKDHERMHNGDKFNKAFLCGICGMELSQSYGLKKHMLIHSNEKPYPCKICGKYFRNLSTLSVHRKRHQGLRPHACPECDLRFTEKTHLKRHLLIHTGEKPYSCDICSKRFNIQYNLRVHRRIHTGEKIHVCQICDKGFTQNSYLKAHLAVHN